MGSLVDNEMCDASSDMKDVLMEVLKELRQDHNKRSHIMEKQFSVRDLTVPLLYVVPLMASLLIGSFTLNAYINKIEQTLSEVQREISDIKQNIMQRSYDRFTRTDFLNFCLTQQVANPNIKFLCDTLIDTHTMNRFMDQKKVK